MWGRIKLKVSRGSRDSAQTATTRDDQQDCTDDEVTLSGFSKLSVSNSSDFVYCLPQSSSDAVPTEYVTDEVSMVHGSSNHSLGSWKNQQQSNGSHIVNNGICSDTSQPHRFHTVNLEQEKPVDSRVEFPQNNSVKYNDFEKYSRGDNCNGYATDKNYSIEPDSGLVVKGMSRSFIKEPLQRACSSPPKLLRREKVKTAEVTESRRSRLSCPLKNNRGSENCFLKPLEVSPYQKSTNYSSKPVDMQPDEALSEVDHNSSTVMCRKPKASSAAQDAQISTQPSTAESTDSGIQPSLCSGSEDKGLISSGAEDDLNGDTSECLTSQNSDYMLLEDAKAMMATSVPAAAGSCADYVDHFVVERFPNTCGSTTADVGTNLMERVSVDYIPYCESVTVLRRINHNPAAEKKVLKETSCGSNTDNVQENSSFATSYNDQLAARQNNASANATRSMGTDSCDSARGKHLPINCQVSDCCSRPSCSLNTSLHASRECYKANGTGNVQTQSQPVGADVDSDDDSYLPPLPSRNYRKTSQGCIEDLSTSSEMNSSRVSLDTDNEEKTHMSWEEVMKEAHALGIPLTAPRCEASDFRSSISLVSSDVSDSVNNAAPCNSSDCMSVSQHSALASSCAPQDKDFPNTSHSSSPSKNSAPAKCASPFKERFRLQNLFSKKKSKKTSDVDGDTRDSTRIVQRHSSAAAEIQRRDLPPLPPKRRQAGGSSMSRSSLDQIPMSAEFARQHAHHRTLSTLTLPARDNSTGMMSQSVWAGSSASVRSQSEVPETAVFSRSISGIESDRNVMTHGKLVCLYTLHCII